ncbi:hypothetical protein F4821DRAFT_230180 [Hypoxylon rubiginosum]|uniref:Uncharacterized protein n=1 Tax=Hypoxylon rubiginosum TaxID=110542 RepID=A0ACC0DBI1_9PEZI|nr:hypothetical protein F4821DRAFT_230180 [Hypoxylon rubiginosum]
MSAIDFVNTLVTSTEQVLTQAPTRADLGVALEHADAATEVATDNRLGEDVVRRCRDLQARCHDLLRRSYCRTESYEKLVYDKAASRADLKRKRCGTVFETDPGEHMVEAIQAVQFGKMLEEEEESREAAAEAQDRKIRFVDEVRDEPVQQVQYA